MIPSKFTLTTLYYNNSDYHNKYKLYTTLVKTTFKSESKMSTNQKITISLCTSDAVINYELLYLKNYVNFY